jgi:hypothetical protein
MSVSKELDCKSIEEQWTEAIQTLVDGTVPDRKNEFREIWQRYAPIVSIVLPRCGYTMQAIANETFGANHASGL